MSILFQKFCFLFFQNRGARQHEMNSHQDSRHSFAPNQPHIVMSFYSSSISYNRTEVET